MRVRLGPFDLLARIGVGGSGEVWRGVHRSQDVPVAVKLITGDRAGDPAYRDAFRREVQAVAGLGHPGVVQVLGTGTVGETAERVSKGRLHQGSPYLAMELAQGSLRDRPGPGSFEDLRLWLLWILDILAESHAAGVVHRDLKPGNVLWFEKPAIEGDVDGASRLRLADFGLAHAMHGGDVSRGTAGTPTYMAPEQFRGRWREFGPPTDLYALGCMAYALASGRPPFQSSDVTELMNAHLGSAPPSLQPRFPVPQGFDAWLGRAMQKAPHHRFQRAADAACALLALETVEGVVPPAPLLGGSSLPSLGDRTLSASATSDNRTERTERTLRTVAAASRPMEHVVRGPVAARLPPPMPGRPRVLPARPSLALVGAGLSLFGLRAVPLVGREVESQEIWSLLRSVAETGVARVVVLRGPAGAGKSRLAEWVTTRADAVGAAFVARATHDPGAGPTHGLVRMLTATVGGAGLSGEALATRVGSWGRSRGLDESDQRALVELLSVQEDNAPTAAERLSLTLRVLATAAIAELDEAQRPLLIWIDDAHWGEDALNLVSWSLEHPVPVLFVLTVQEDALRERPVEHEQLEVLEANPAVSTIPIGPLSASARRVLVQQLLFLEGELAEQVDQRTQGIPLFAVQLVGDWVRRGLLTIGHSGFVLRPGAVAEIPDGIHELWVERLQRAVPGATEALELAAVMGTTVERAEWKAAARVARIAVPPDVESLLVEQRLATSSAESFSFVHGMLRESLERSARDSGRFEGLQRAAATALQIRWEAHPSRGLVERVGRHFLRAGEVELALTPLLDAARERRGVSDYEGALGVLNRRAAAMDQLGVGPSDPRRGEEWVARADVLICLGRLEEAEAEANKVVRIGRKKHWESLVGPALRHAAVAVGKRGQLVAASRRLARAVEASRYGGDEREWALCVLHQGDVARMQGTHEVAVGHYRSALQRFQGASDLRGEGLALLGLAGVHAAMGHVEQAVRLCSEAIERFERRGARFAVASAQVALGDLHRQQGHHDAATSAYAQAERGMIAVGSVEEVVVHLNQAMLVLQQGDADQSRERFRVLLQPLRDSKRATLLAICEAGLITSDVLRCELRSVAHHLDLLEPLLQRDVVADRDLVWCFARARSGLSGRLAERVRALHLEQLRRLGHPG